MNILEKIVADIRKDLGYKKALVSHSDLEAMPLFDRKTLSMSQSIRNSSTGIIAEHKRRSPSKPHINFGLRLTDVAQGYQQGGVSSMSVLTNTQYFGGSLEDLSLARAACDLPLLRKEFIVDEYQILEAKAHGADAILLIAACLEREEIKQLSVFAQSLGLEVLLEVHNRAELDKSLMPSLNLLGVNNRDLTSFSVSLETSKTLAELIPNEFIKVSESGIGTSDAVRDLKRFGYQAFLMGEHFMKTNDPGEAAADFIKAIIQ
jgi:indole-3-glycerol phosphate synthase